ncbi:MAG TPA: thiamine pyrophosphate-binding protein [Streptosporangiaceae bacterium]|nr:thiamine pyrophosphate-binding protein [Streptosporangiaceae bacterium]
MSSPGSAVRPAGPAAATAVWRCRDLFFAYLEDHGIRYVFGNPGTTELPLLDGCRDHPSVDYKLSLHEDVAVAEAMGYARASGTIGVVNLHVTPGLAHGLGNLYNAFRARVPLLVTAGQHHTGLLVHEPILTADLAALVRPFTKWAHEVRIAEELPIALQRAFKELTTPPYGPVFLSFPMDLMLDEYPTAGGAPPVRTSRTAPAHADRTELERAAALLAGADHPMIVAGDGVGHARAWPEVAALAEAVGATVRTESYSTLWNFPSRHPLFGGPLPNTAGAMRPVFAAADVVFLCGVTAQTPVSRYDGGGPLVPWHVRTVALDDSPWEVGKNHPVEVGLIGDVGAGLRVLVDAVHRAPPPAALVAARRAAAERANAERAGTWARRVSAARSGGRLSPVAIAAELRERLPDAIFVDETISNREAFVNVLDFADPLSYFAANGLSLGYSPGAAVGIQQALPDRRVVNIVGDGSLLYYPHALWNAANRGTPVVFVVLNNGQYRVLKLIVDRMGGPWSASGDLPPGLDIAGPPVDFVPLARSLGVAGERAATPAELRSALDRAVESGRPYLIDAVLEQGGSA